MSDLKVLLISTYELGRQPFGLASPAAWLGAAGFHTISLDLSRQSLDEEAVCTAGLIAFYLPMHTATRIAVRALERVRELNPAAHLCGFGLYAPVNAGLLRGLGVGTILGGEFEPGLLSLARRLEAGSIDPGQPQIEPEISLARQNFLVPYRDGLPPLEKYAHLTLPDDSTRVVGYTEASRGCKHLCRHCPIVPVYNGTFRIVQREVVLEDIRRQVAAGAQHITFGDPDFFNGAGHSMEIVEALHREHPGLSYDVTIKVEHLLKHAVRLPALRETGCAFVTTAVESVDDHVLRVLDKGHTRTDFIRLAGLMRELGLFLVPTFVPFTPWTTLEGYEDLLATLTRLRLVEHVAPVQLTIRLLIPAGSRLLDVLPLHNVAIGPFQQEALSYPWSNPDPRVDQLQCDLEAMMQRETKAGASRTAIFREAWELLQRAVRKDEHEAPAPVSLVEPAPPRVTIPYLTEPWYC
ncbi:MAG TPA: CUAEP/CCAEP-tail radical SAM protein [Terriglobales bacterium]|nr:CUAEP/CCAEP-tail radical SAM protein [Terriglobales bacterium]